MKPVRIVIVGVLAAWMAACASVEPAGGADGREDEVAPIKGAALPVDDEEQSALWMEIDDYVSGYPVLVGWILKHAFEIVLFLLLTIAMIFALLWAYFRRWHGVFIPALAALATAIVWPYGVTKLVSPLW